MRLNWPWWATIILATACYSGLRYGIPAMAEEMAWLQPMASLTIRLAPIFTIGLLLLGAKQLYDGGSEEEPAPDTYPEEQQDNTDNGQGQG